MFFYHHYPLPSIPTCSLSPVIHSFTCFLILFFLSRFSLSIIHSRLHIFHLILNLTFLSSYISSVSDYLLYHALVYVFSVFTFYLISFASLLSFVLFSSIITLFFLPIFLLSLITLFVSHSLTSFSLHLSFLLIGIHFIIPSCIPFPQPNSLLRFSNNFLPTFPPNLPSPVITSTYKYLLPINYPFIFITFNPLLTQLHPFPTFPFHQLSL